MDLDTKLKKIRLTLESKHKNINVEYDGLRDVADNSVTKSNALARAYYRFGLVEKRCMEALISKLNPLRSNSDYQDIELSAVEYAKAYGVSDKHAYQHLTNAGDALVNRVITIDSPRVGVDREKLTLMSRVQYLSDKGRVICTFNNLVVPHLLHIRNQFTKYPLRDAANFSSSYTWRFYEILVSWAENKKDTNGLLIGWIDHQNIEELREMLGVPVSYKWSDFQRQVLNVVVNELKEKANIHVLIETKKTSRKITHLNIQFIEDDQQQLPLEGGSGS